jgi:PAS domain S-box-containing protein
MNYSVENENNFILIAEDSSTQAQEIQFFLQSNGYEVVVASDGQDAIEWLENHNKIPEVIVSDIVMPRMDGYQFCKAVRKSERFSKIPFILLTSLSEPYDIIKSIEAGANKFLTKPFNQERLLKVIDELCINMQRREIATMEEGIELVFGGNDFLIKADTEQILDLLLSSYEDSYYKNLQLQESRSELERLNAKLEEKVHERTKELIQSNIEIKALIDHSPVAMLICDGIGADGMVKMINQKFVDTFGYTMEEISDISQWWPLAYPDEVYRNSIQAKWEKYVENIQLNQSTEGVEASVTTKNGEKRYVRVSLATVGGASNIVTFEDFTARKDGELKLRKSLIDTVKVMASTVELRDAYTAGHQRRVAALAKVIGQKLGLSEDRIEGLLLASQIHDIGKIKVPAEILTKPSQLSNLEYELVKTHAEAGYQLLKEIDFPWQIATIIRQHHEKLDGSGYPLGLYKEDIIQESQILTVSDIVESMASHRPYRAALGIEAALQEIMNERGIKLDSLVVDACFKVFEEGFTFPLE